MRISNGHHRQAAASRAYHTLVPVKQLQGGVLQLLRQQGGRRELGIGGGEEEGVEEGGQGWEGRSVADFSPYFTEGRGGGDAGAKSV
jgi:hypothetical protein